ncbi:hypothetical protein ACPC54_01875 [Kitasatospora sp. NPDC094028]
MRNRQLAVTTAAALLCLGALSACGPNDDKGGQDAGKSAAPTATVPAVVAATAAPGATGGAGGGAKGSIPAAAWMSSRSVPMDETYHWAALAPVAKPVTGDAATFKGMELCRTPVAKDDAWLYTGKAAARAALNEGGAEHWTAQQTLVYHGDPRPSSGAKQATNLAYAHLVEAVKNCAQSVPGATVKVASADDAPYFAATVTVPQPGGSTVTLHEYAVAAGGSVSELAVFATAKAGAQPKDAWKAPEDKYVGTGMTAPLCEALPGC